MTRHKTKKPTILLRSGWQPVNIGDIAHWVGALCFLRDHVPEARVILWPIADLGDAAQLLRGFPGTDVVHGDLAPGMPPNPWLQQAIARSDLLLHGSGASICVDALAGWRELTDRPYGCLGVSFTGAAYGQPFVDQLQRTTVDVLSGASFLYTRETLTADFLSDQGVTADELTFAPDATFAFDLADSKRADRFLERRGLSSKELLVVVPKLRVDPYWRIRPTRLSLDEIDRCEDINAKSAVRDNQFLVDCVVSWVRKNGGMVLIAPEMTYEIETGERYVLSRLPEDVRSSAVAMNRYWLPDEAFALYGRARAVVSIEMHSPILAVRSGTPAIHLQQPTDSHKAQMWTDLGMGRWLFDIETSESADVCAELLDLHSSRQKTEQRLSAALEAASLLHKRAGGRIRELLGL